MPTISFQEIFASGDHKRDAFLSRLFGIFSEEIVRTWCACDKAPYEDIGRPALKAPEDKRPTVLDFTFRDRDSEELFIGELKCELENENYRHLRLSDASQLDHHTRRGFRRFLEMAKNPKTYTVTVRGEERKISGAILIWGTLDPSQKKKMMEATQLMNILSLEEMASDLLKWKFQDYLDLVNNRQTWSSELFSGLTDPSRSPEGL